MTSRRSQTLSVFIIFFTLLFSVLTSKAQDCVGNFELNSHAELAEFAELGCVNVIGNLKVGDDHITDMSALNTIKHVTGYLWIAVTRVQDLSGLSNLEQVDSFFLIYYNLGLKNLNGLQKLRSVGDRFGISGNDYLISTAYLDNLESIGRLEMRSNSFLDTLGEFPKLKHIGTTLEITQNPLNAGLSAFHNLEHVTSIELKNGNPTIDGFEKIDSLQRLKIYESHDLESIQGFHSVAFIDNLTIADNVLLTSIDGFDNLTKVEFFQIDNSGFTDIPVFPMLHKIDALYLTSNPMLTQIQPFSPLDSLGSLTISRNISLKEISGFTFPENMGHVTIQRNNLLENVQLDGVIDSIGMIDISFNPSLRQISQFNDLRIADRIKLEHLDSLTLLPSFPQLQKISDYVRIGNVNPGPFNQFPQLTIVGSKGFSVSGIFLDSVEFISPAGFPNLLSTHHLSITGTTFGDLTFFNQLNTINGDLLVEKNSNLTSLFPDDKMKNINGKITFQQNEVLENLNALDSIATSAVSSIAIKNNPQLSSCNSYWVCKAVNEGIPSAFSQNASGCISEYDVRKQCDLTYSSIVAATFYDQNQNGMLEPGEPMFSNATINIHPNAITLLSDDLPVTYFLPFGSYRISSTYQNMHGWMLTNAQDTIDITLSQDHDVDTLFFGYYPTIVIDSAKVYLSTTQNVSNRVSTLQTVVYNRGTTLFNGTVWMEIDTNVSNVGFHSSPDHLAANKVGYDIINLPPGKKLRYYIDYTVPSPPDFTFGSLLTFVSNVENEEGEIISTATINPKVYSSFDPNDKAVSPARENTETLLNEELHYRIRFQNTGNYPATDVIVIDTLDTNLDISTLKIISSSHIEKLVTSINDHIVQFKFSNIYLIDSIANEPLSHGYVDFSISPVNSIFTGTIVENDAAIYFDANPPVITNITTTKFVDQLSVVLATEETDYDKINLHLYPNPASEDLFIKDVLLQSQTSVVSLISAEGKVIDVTKVQFNQHGEAKVLLPPGIPEGIYLISIKTEEDLLLGKVCIVK